jgi:glycosyltransferase involved in cell wall biosynthesis
MEIVVVDDFSDDPSTVETLALFQPDVQFHQHALNWDFAAHKNFATALCSGEWILQLDGDEYLNPAIISALPYFLPLNPEVEAYQFARVNTLAGLTRAHVRENGWKLTVLEGYAMPIVNFPDPQTRLYRNDPRIRWIRKLHETVTGYSRLAVLPQSPQYAIHHHKDIGRQSCQNDFYDELYQHHLNARRQV